MAIQVAAVGKDVSEDVFGQAFNEGLVHQLVTTYMSNARAGTRAQKTRSEVSGGGIKPWRQKGTGRARSGTSRSPIWRTGGVTFAAKPQSYEKKLNRKMYRSGLRSLLSELVRQERILVADELSVSEPKTKVLTSLLKADGLSNVLIVLPAEERNIELAARNLKDVEVCTVAEIDPVSLVGFEKVCLTKDALALLEERLK